MIRRRYRLRRAADFRRVREHGRTRRGTLVTLGYLPNGLGHNRYGFVVGKRLGKAVVRNKVKRRLREMIRRKHPDLRQGYDIVLVARPGIEKHGFWEIDAELDRLLTGAGLTDRGGVH